MDGFLFQQVYAAKNLKKRDFTSCITDLEKVVNKGKKLLARIYLQSSNSQAVTWVTGFLFSISSSAFHEFS
jgi:hypothetical protein